MFTWYYTNLFKTYGSYSQWSLIILLRNLVAHISHIAHISQKIYLTLDLRILLYILQFEWNRNFDDKRTRVSLPLSATVFIFSTKYIPFTVQCFLSSQYFKYALCNSHCNNHWWLLGLEKEEILQCLCFHQISSTTSLFISHLKICN